MIKRASAVFCMVVSSFCVFTATAFASHDAATAGDPLDGAGDSFFSTVTSYLTTKLIPAVIALALVGVAVSMLIKWGKRAAKSS